uniref:uncharacterized protein LOC118543934 isoform X1 n=1 Tax=Halichoerus grypus TaxID=9711 RepID=UPI0016593956|nr:uncharacterized protein LOC118543934 isoform X1 [Halichoerus grypus]
MVLPTSWVVSPQKASPPPPPPPGLVISPQEACPLDQVIPPQKVLLGIGHVSLGRSPSGSVLSPQKVLLRIGHLSSGSLPSGSVVSPQEVSLRIGHLLRKPPLEIGSSLFRKCCSGLVMSSQEASPQYWSSLFRKPLLRIGHLSSESLTRDWSCLLRKALLRIGHLSSESLAQDQVIPPQKVSLRIGHLSLKTPPHHTHTHTYLRVGNFSSGSLAQDWLSLLGKPPLRIGQISSESLTQDWSCLRNPRSGWVISPQEASRQDQVIPPQKVLLKIGHLLRKPSLEIGSSLRKSHSGLVISLQEVPPHTHTHTSGSVISPQEVLFRIGYLSSGSLPSGLVISPQSLTRDWSCLVRKPPLWIESSLLRKSCMGLVMSPQEGPPRDRSSLLRKSCSGSVISPQEASPQDRVMPPQKILLRISHFSSGSLTQDWPSPQEASS